MRFVVPVGRVLLALPFLMAGMTHFSHGAAAYAASQGVPYATLAVPASGLLALAGGLSVALGWRARVGAWLLVVFLVPVTIAMHAFWNVKDSMMAQMQMANFVKNLSILGGALLVAWFGAGPVSLDRQGASGPAGAASGG